MRIITLTMLLIISGQGLAADCDKLRSHVTAARDAVVASFIDYDLVRLDRETENLIFWDTYIQVECNRGTVETTPVVWLSRQRHSDLSPYLAGYLFWLESLRESDLDITPAGLVRGRSLE